MPEFGIPTKLICLCRMTLNKTKSTGKIGKDLRELFDTKQGLRQGGTLSFDLFNILMETILIKSAVNPNETINSINLREATEV